MCPMSCAAVGCFLVLLPGKGGLLREYECALCLVLLSVDGCFLVLLPGERRNRTLNIAPSLSCRVLLLLLAHGIMQAIVLKLKTVTCVGVKAIFQ
jgi:hypothetical protein